MALKAAHRFLSIASARRDLTRRNEAGPGRRKHASASCATGRRWAPLGPGLVRWIRSSRPAGGSPGHLRRLERPLLMIAAAVWSIVAAVYYPCAAWHAIIFLLTLRGDLLLVVMGMLYASRKTSYCFVEGLADTVRGKSGSYRLGGIVGLSIIPFISAFLGLLMYQGILLEPLSSTPFVLVSLACLVWLVDSGSSMSRQQRELLVVGLAGAALLGLDLCLWESLA